MDKKILLYCAAVFLIGFAVYANTLTADFIWDDEYLILNNSQIKSFSHVNNVFKTYVGYGSENINNFYRPVQELSNMADYALWGEKPSGFHLTNTLLHAVVSVLVLIFAASITRNPLASFFAAVFYAVHPAHTEAVAYIAGRADSLYVLFLLLSFITFVKALETTGMRDLLLYAASVLLFTVSILSKEMAMVMPLLIFFYMFCFLRSTERSHIYDRCKRRWIPYALITAVYGVLRMTVLNFANISPASAFNKIPFIYRILTFFRAVAVYFSLLLFPADLHMERAIRITDTVFDFEAFLSFVMILLVIWLAYKTYKKKQRIASFAILWFFINLLPVSNIVPINSFIAEHWIYAASIGPVILIGLGLSKMWYSIPKRGKSLRVGFTIAFVLLIWSYASVTISRNKDWHDEISFFTSTLRYHPRNARLYLNLGNTYFEKGEMDKAIEVYRRALDINKDYAIAYGNIGSAYLNMNNVQEAEEYLRKAVDLQYKYPIAHYDLGVIYYNKHRYEEAIKELLTATDQLPQLYQAWNTLGRAYLSAGMPDKARESFQKSLSIMPNQDDIKKLL